MSHTDLLSDTWRHFLLFISMYAIYICYFQCSTGIPSQWLCAYFLCSSCSLDLGTALGIYLISPCLPLVLGDFIGDVPCKTGDATGTWGYSRTTLEGSVKTQNENTMALKQDNVPPLSLCLSSPYNPPKP